MEIAPTAAKRDNGILVQDESTLNINSDVTINAHNWVSAVTLIWAVTLNSTWVLTAEDSFAIAGNGKTENWWYEINIKSNIKY